MALYVTNLLHKEKLNIEKEKLESEVAPPKEVKKPFSLKFTELTDEELEEKLQAFEMKYELDSETLYQLYQQGKAPEWIEDRILWAGLYRLKKDEDDLEVKSKLIFSTYKESSRLELSENWKPGLSSFGRDRGWVGFSSTS